MAIPMSSPEVLVPIFTIESDWIAPQRYEDTPYQRIVGIESNDGTEHWVSGVVPMDHTSSFDRLDTTRTVLALPEAMTSRLIAFVDTFMDFPRDNYNCHAFAFWLKGVTNLGSEYGVEEAKALIKAGECVEAPLKLGEHGVYGGTMNSSPKPDHSVIGLGPERDSCLQVTEVGGHLGLRTYEAIAKYYENQNTHALAGYNLVANYGLYALRGVEH